MDPALQQAPAPCRDPDAWRTTGDVRYPYMGVDTAVVEVPDLLPDLALLKQAFDLAPTTPVPNGSIGYDSPAETTYRQELGQLAQAAKFFARGPAKTRGQINALGAAAVKILTSTIPKLYTEDARRLGFPLSSPLPDKPPYNRPEAAIGRDNLRHDIIDAYVQAAQLLWCAQFGMAQVEAYQANRDEYEAPMKPSPGGLVDPAWTQYEPVDFDALDEWGITKDFGTGPEPVTELPEEEQPETGGGGAGAIAIVAALGIGAFLLLRK